MERQERVILCFGALITLLALVSGPVLAGTWDFNPGQSALKHTHHYEADMEGQGYVMVYERVDTNNLSLDEYMHGSGSFDEAEILDSVQKSTGSSSDYYYYMASDGQIKQALRGATSTIKYTKQNQMTYSPVTFAYGTGWYAANPITFNSLLKDKTQAKTYQEAASMHHQLEYARGYKGDILVDLNCTGPDDKKKGYGLIQMSIEDEVTAGTVHVGELLRDPGIKSKPVGKEKGHIPAWKNPIIEIDANYLGDFRIKKNMKLEFEKSYQMDTADWLPCCMGGFFDIPNVDKTHSGMTGIFDCSCRETSLKSFKPAWNGTAAQFPNDVYMTTP